MPTTIITPAPSDHFMAQLMTFTRDRLDALLVDNDVTVDGTTYDASLYRAAIRAELEVRDTIPAPR